MLQSRGRLVLAVAIAACALGCATAPKEVDLPPQSLTEAPTSTAEQEAALVPSGRTRSAEVEDEDLLDGEDGEEVAGVAAAPAAEATPEELPGRKHTIVIQSGGTNQAATSRSLQQASQSERERRAGANTPVAVITNQNLAELAEGGSITVIGPDGRPLPADAAAAAPAGATNASGAPEAAGEKTAAPAVALTAASSAPPAGGSTAAAPNPAPSAALSEEYWRSQALKIRLDWKAAVEEVDELQGEVADLRRRFYQEDDPFYRDNEIKPSWDRALDRLQDAKAAAEAHERRLTRFLEEGHRAGALPGWLREGVEYEPPATPDHTPAERRRTDDPWEPKVLEEEPRDP